MVNDIKSILSNVSDSLRGADAAGQADQAAQMRKTQEAQMAQMAKKASEDSMRAQNQNLHLQTTELLKVLDNIVHEGFNLPKTNPGEGAGNQSGNFFQGGDAEAGMQRDLQVMKEFIRESNYLITQGMDINQIITKLKVDQGGQFWQNFQQILQKQGALAKADLSRLGEGSADLSKSVRGDAILGKESLKAQELMKSIGSQALLELLRAETNPQFQKEQFLLALQLLSKGNLTESSQRLLSYLRKRGGFSDQELNYYYGKQESRKDIFQGEIPFQREERKRTSLWYLLAGLGGFALSIALGCNLAGSITIGVATIVLVFVFSLILKK